MEKECKTCHGTGQISYFKGVSRFLLTEEECPECAGLGFILENDNKVKEAPLKRKPKKKKKVNTVKKCI